MATGAPHGDSHTRERRSRENHVPGAPGASPPRSSRSSRAAAASVLLSGSYALGALLLAGEAAVHVQQFIAIFHDVRWIGPLFVANAAACAVAIAGLAYDRTRALAAFAGIAASALALAGLVLSYAVGLFGWMEAGLRSPIALAIGTEAGAVIVLGAALGGTAVRSNRAA
jgi:hypothetical protein